MELEIRVLEEVVEVVLLRVDSWDLAVAVEEMEAVEIAALSWIVAFEGEPFLYFVEGVAAMEEVAGIMLVASGSFVSNVEGQIHTWHQHEASKR